MNFILICYGPDESHMLGTCFVIKKLLELQRKLALPIEKISVATDRPGFFRHPLVDYSVITESELASWSFNGQYHFNVKNRALRSILTKEQTPFCYLDNDVFPRHSGFFKRLREVWDHPDKIGMFKREHRVLRSTNNSSRALAAGLKGRYFPLPSGRRYIITPSSEMWGSALIASASPQIVEILDDAHLLIQNWLRLVNSHTIEQFAFSEVAKLYDHSLIEFAPTTNHFSTSGRKKYALNILRKNKQSLVSPDTELPQVMRPIVELLRQKWPKIFQF